MRAAAPRLPGELLELFAQVGAGNLEDHHPVPELHVHEEPEPVPVVTAAQEMLGDEREQAVKPMTTLVDRARGNAIRAFMTHIGSLSRRRRRNWLAGKLVKKPIIIPICIWNQ